MTATSSFEELEEVLRSWESATEKDFEKLRKEIRAQAKARDQVVHAAHNLLRSGNGTSDFDLVYPALDSRLRKLLWNYAIADAIAMRYKDPASRAGSKIALSMAVASVGFWAFNSGIQSLRLPGGIILVLFTIVSFISRKQFQNRRVNFLTARSLAEALRVDFFQRLVGSGFDTLKHFEEQRDTHSKSNHMLALKALERAMASSGYPPQTAATKDGLPPEGIKWAEIYWIHGQQQYFAGENGSAKRESGSANSSEALLTFCFRLTSIVVLLSVLILVAPLASHYFPVLAKFTNILQALKSAGALLTPILGIATAFLHQQSAEHAILAQKYRRAGLVLTAASSQLMNPNLSAEERIAKLKDVGYQSIAETADWGVHQREQSNHIAFR
jgi:hypothetical protein